jgi:thymidine kinase
MAYIDLLLGCMFAQKTTELIRLCRRYTLAKQKVLIIQWKDDVRYDTNDVLCTNDGVKYGQTMRCDDLSKITDEEIQKYHVVAIDEGQFFDGLDLFCRRLLILNVKGIITALSGTSNVEVWENISKIIPYCRVRTLTAICYYCGEEACFTEKFVKLQPSGEQNTDIDYGANDKYRAVCNQHHPKFNLHY